jgi:biopolymer transport protein ExbD
MRLDPGPVEDAELQLTPLIDMVFLLLVFFLASTTFATEEVDMDLQLPEATSGTASREVVRLVVTVGSDGGLHVNGRPVSAEGLRQRLRAAAVRNRDQEVEIRGDTRVQFGAVATALDACLAASLKRVSIAAQPAEESGR